MLAHNGSIPGPTLNLWCTRTTRYFSTSTTVATGNDGGPRRPAARSRRQERDLHDGTQQRLVSLSLDLQLVRRKVADQAAAEMVAGAIQTPGDALTTLRELARGIHSALLSDRGHPPALAALAHRSPVPVELDLELEGGPPLEVDTAAYFVAAEALTNIAKYAHASVARVSATNSDGVFTLTSATMAWVALSLTAAADCVAAPTGSRRSMGSSRSTVQRAAEPVSPR